MLKLKLAAVAMAALLMTTSTIAYAHDIDDCVLEHTYDCLDDADFWGCYDFILEGCQGHGKPHSAADLNKLKAKARVIRNNSLAAKK